MEITEVRIYRVEDAGSLKAYASVTFDGAYVVHRLCVMEGEHGLWVRMPAVRNRRGEYRDVFHPISREAREMLVSAVLEAYEKGV
ncbi:MAG: septation protein spoVG [Euryarchaeota archaeon]|nr:septation protein spoVG [Euryarchaeota archaeon]